MENDIKTCQICGRGIKAKKGIIAHHGYKRLDIGWQTASCMGARALPYEVSCDIIPPAIERVKIQITNIENDIKEYLTNPPDLMIERDVFSRNVREFKKPEGFDPNNNARKSWYGTYECEYEGKLRKMERQLKENINFKVYLEDRLKNWVKIA